MSFLVVAIVGVGVMATAATAKLGMALAGRKKRIQEQKDAKAEMEAKKEEYANLDTSNLAANVRNQFTDMENAYEDVTVNLQQAEFEAEQTQQQQANIMQGMQGAAGGSGIAALAQAMAGQGQLATQRASASIGAQESRIQQMQAGEASRLQMQERVGEQQAQTTRLAGAETSRSLEWQKTGTQLGMAQQRLGAANKARADAKAQQMQAVGDIGESGKTLASVGMSGMGGGGGGGGGGGAQYSSGGMTDDPSVAGGTYGEGMYEEVGTTYDPSDRKLKKNIKKIGESPSGLNIYNFEFKDSKYGKGVFQGVMSDEVPSKVVTKKDGYDVVDYSKLDVEFKQIQTQ
jgi:hypothetical protein